MVILIDVYVEFALMSVVNGIVLFIAASHDLLHVAISLIYFDRLARDVSVCCYLATGLRWHLAEASAIIAVP